MYRCSVGASLPIAEAHAVWYTVCSIERTMKANISLGPLGMGVAAGATLIETGRQTEDFALTTAGATICVSSLVLGYAVARSRSNQAERPKDVKTK